MFGGFALYARKRRILWIPVPAQDAHYRSKADSQKHLHDLLASCHGMTNYGCYAASLCTVAFRVWCPCVVSHMQVQYVTMGCVTTAA